MVFVDTTVAEVISIEGVLKALGVSTVLTANPFDLAAAIDTVKQAAAAAEKPIFLALDVFETEPLPENSTLRNRENVLITPHVSGQTFLGLREKEDFFFELARENLQRYLDGKPLKNRVDLSTGYRVTTG